MWRVTIRPQTPVYVEFLKWQQSDHSHLWNSWSMHYAGWDPYLKVHVLCFEDHNHYMEFKLAWS